MKETHASILFKLLLFCISCPSWPQLIQLIVLMNCVFAFRSISIFLPFYYNWAEPPVRTGVCVGGRQEGREKEAKVFLFGLSALHGILSHNSCVSSMVPVPTRCGFIFCWVTSVLGLVTLSSLFISAVGMAVASCCGRSLDFFTFPLWLWVFPFPT